MASDRPLFAVSRRLFLGAAGIAASLSSTARGWARDRHDSLAGTGRVRHSFNADWRFVFDDPEGAQRPAFDDHGWQATGLPHSFSIPYFQSRDFPVGIGWYRKRFTLPRLPATRRLSLEFEGAFQDAEIFVNGVSVGRHRGGYTGFPVDITHTVRPGDNVVAVRLSNEWQATLAPRAGEHVFSGGLYRDVWLVATDAVHVPWCGTRITTPELTATSGRVRAETEIANDTAAPMVVTIRSAVRDARGATLAHLPDVTQHLPVGGTATATQLSAPITSPRLWTPETPDLYTVVTELLVDGRPRDRFETCFGFRWVDWTPHRGFFLNGEHRYFKGANVHQDQAGWGDAVTNSAIARDVQLIKDAGFDFIRGSHYPHDPAFVAATDRIGVMFLCEMPFWGIGGFKEGGKWLSPAYPTDPADRPGFEANVKQQLTEAIRIFRNNPSVIAWSMCNEVFFSAPESMPEVRRFLAEMVALSHQLDPSRKAAIGGAQRGDIDKIGDIAAYNGDGAALFIDPGVPSMVSEYGSGIAFRPGNFLPKWGDLLNGPGASADNPASWHYPWRSGQAVWAGFDHGSIAGRRFGSMGIIDYFRLPKRVWYWYRDAYRDVAPPAWAEAGTPTALRLASSAPHIERADGTDDVQLVVTVLDADGRAISNSPPVTLTIDEGPGEFPTGRTIRFAPDSDIAIRDGQAAIAMRSWQSGISRIRASSPGLSDAVLHVATVSGPPFVPGHTALAPDRPYTESGERRIGYDEAADAQFGTDNPTGSSSSAPGHSSRFANDGDAKTWWQAAANDPAPWLSISPEKIIQFRKVEVTFPGAGNYRFVIELAQDGGGWQTIADQSATTDTGRTRSVTTRRVVGSTMRIRLTHVPDGMPAGIAEILITGGM